MKCGMSCSLFEVLDGKGKPTNGSLTALINKLERDRMVSHPVPHQDTGSSSSCRQSSYTSSVSVYQLL